jgi:hypothetical protein
MPTYIILYAVSLALPTAAVTAIIIYALKKYSTVNASFWSKRFGFTLNAMYPSTPAPLAQVGPVPGTPDLPNSLSGPQERAPGTTDRASAALPPRTGPSALVPPASDFR